MPGRKTRQKEDGSELFLNWSVFFVGFTRLVMESDHGHKNRPGGIQSQSKVPGIESIQNMAAARLVSPCGRRLEGRSCPGACAARLRDVAASRLSTRAVEQ